MIEVLQNVTCRFFRFLQESDKLCICIRVYEILKSDIVIKDTLSLKGFKGRLIGIFIKLVQTEQYFIANDALTKLNLTDRVFDIACNQQTGIVDIVNEVFIDVKGDNTVGICHSSVVSFGTKINTKAAGQAGMEFIKARILVDREHIMVDVLEVDEVKFIRAGDAYVVSKLHEIDNSIFFASCFVAELTTEAMSTAITSLGSLDVKRTLLVKVVASPIHRTFESTFSDL